MVLLHKKSCGADKLQTWLQMAMWWNAELLRSSVPDQLVCSDRDIPQTLCVGYHTAGALQGLFVLCFCYFLGKICNVCKSQVSGLTFHVFYQRKWTCFLSFLPFLFHHLLSAKLLPKEDAECRMVSEHPAALCIVVVQTPQCSFATLSLIKLGFFCCCSWKQCADTTRSCIEQIKMSMF